MDANDRRVREEVTAQLRWDVRIEDAGIRVEVENGKVALGGGVRSHAERRAAEENAWDVPGVISVSNRIQVATSPEDCTRHPGDEVLAARVRAMLRWSLGDRLRILYVTARDGCVRLQGAADSFWARSEAERQVADMLGVERVDNRLVVETSSRFDDRSIFESLLAAMSRKVDLVEARITVTVEAGVVTLRGAVPDRHRGDAAVQAAACTPGVVDVRNELTVDWSCQLAS